MTQYQGNDDETLHRLNLAGCPPSPPPPSNPQVYNLSVVFMTTDTGNPIAIWTNYSASGM